MNLLSFTPLHPDSTWDYAQGLEKPVQDNLISRISGVLYFWQSSYPYLNESHLSGFDPLFFFDGPLGILLVRSGAAQVNARLLLPTLSSWE